MLGGMMGKGGGTTFSMPAAQGGGSLPAGTGVMASPSQPPAGGFSWGKLGQGMLDAQKGGWGYGAMDAVGKTGAQYQQSLGNIPATQGGQPAGGQAAGMQNLLLLLQLLQSGQGQPGAGGGGGVPTFSVPPGGSYQPGYGVRR